MARRRTWRGRVARFAAKATGAFLLAHVVLVLPWRWIPPPTTSFVLQARLERGPDSVHYDWTPWREISPHLAIAVVAAEDQKFPDHRGFDLDSIADALGQRRARPRGASTISQQVAKNLYLWPGRSLARKALEAWLTVWIELLWPKRRILEVYLNAAEFAPGIFGAGPASRRLFGVSPGALSPREAAQLAAVLPSPRRMRAADPSPYVLRRAYEIARAVRALGGPGYLSRL
jgi:monofunctional biosynthetic peptidoglycan transglycosylase